MHTVQDLLDRVTCIQQAAFSHGLMFVRVYFVELVGWTLVVSARPLLSLTGRGLFMSGLDPHDVGVGAIARIYLFEQVGLSTVGSAIYCGGARVLFRPREVGLPAMLAVGPSSLLVRDSYRQVHTGTIDGGKQDRFALIRVLCMMDCL